MLWETESNALGQMGRRGALVRHGLYGGERKKMLVAVIKDVTCCDVNGKQGAFFL